MVLQAGCWRWSPGCPAGRPLVDGHRAPAQTAALALVELRRRPRRAGHLSIDADRARRSALGLDGWRLFGRSRRQRRALNGAAPEPHIRAPPPSQRGAYLYVESRVTGEGWITTGERGPSYEAARLGALSRLGERHDCARISRRARPRPDPPRADLGLRQDRPRRDRPGAGRRRRRAGLHRRHPRGHRRRRPAGEGRRRPHRLSGDDGRAGEDPAPGRARRPAGRARRARARRGDDRARHRRHRSALREPLPVRGDRGRAAPTSPSASRTSTSAARR